VNHEYKQPPPIIPPEYKVSKTKTLGILTIFSIIVYGSAFFASLNQEKNPISPFQSTVLIFLLTFGAILGMIVTNHQLSRISKAYQFTENKIGALVLSFGPLILFTIFSFFVSSLAYPSEYIRLLSAYSWVISFFITRVILFIAFERKENMHLVTSWRGPTTFLVPKPPTSETNSLKTAAKRDS